MHKNMKVEMPMVHAKIARKPTTCTPNCWPVGIPIDKKVVINYQ
jgi:hypothetical protein